MSQESDEGSSGDEDEEAIDWDSVSRSNYASRLLNAQAWIAAANELQASARLLEPRVDEYWRTLRLWSKGEGLFVEYGCHTVYLMLVGFTIENLCKSCLASGLSGADRRHVQDKGVLPVALRSHDLVALARAVGLETLPAEEELLRRLQRAAVWHGRYPIAVQYDKALDQIRLSDGHETSLTWLGAKDIELCNALVARLRGHVDAPESYRA